MNDIEFCEEDEPTLESHLGPNRQPTRLPTKEESGRTCRLLERLDQDEYLALNQRVLCDLVSDLVEGSRAAEDYLPLLRDLLMACDDQMLPKGYACWKDNDEQ